MQPLNTNLWLGLLLVWVMLINNFQTSIRVSIPKQRVASDSLHFFPAGDSRIQYTGRVDFSDPRLPRFWAPGVYIQASFEGTSCDIWIRDEVLYGKSHNYIEIIIDDGPPFRIRVPKENRFSVSSGLSSSAHSITICKATESGIGYIEFGGIFCDRLLVPKEKPRRKIECIGNSITCGSGSNVSAIPCGTGEWYDQQDAFMSYGALTARLLKAQWQLTAVSGIGLIRSCCNMNITMPQVFDKVNQRNDSIAWDFSKYELDLVTVCLGQNDGILDSAIFCGRYIAFIKDIRNHYPHVVIFCLSSPMADDKLNATLKNYLLGIAGFLHTNGTNQVYTFFFSKRYHQGCGDHPNLEEHQLMAAELSSSIKKVMDW